MMPTAKTVTTATVMTKLIPAVWARAFHLMLMLMI